MFPSQRFGFGTECVEPGCYRKFDCYRRLLKEKVGIFSRIVLVVVESNSQSSRMQNSTSQIRFTVDIIPSVQPDFLIHQAIFTDKYEKYVRRLENKSLEGKNFRVFLKDHTPAFKMMRIVSDSSPVEPTLYPDSLWRNIKVYEAERAHSHFKAGLKRDLVHSYEVDDFWCERVSFWDIQFEGQDEI